MVTSLRACVVGLRVRQRRRRWRRQQQWRWRSVPAPGSWRLSSSSLPPRLPLPDVASPTPAPSLASPRLSAPPPSPSPRVQSPSSRGLQRSSVRLPASQLTQRKTRGVTVVTRSQPASASNTGHSESGATIASLQRCDREPYVWWRDKVKQEVLPFGGALLPSGAQSGLVGTALLLSGCRPRTAGPQSEVLLGSRSRTPRATTLAAGLEVLLGQYQQHGSLPSSSVVSTPSAMVLKICMGTKNVLILI